MRQRFERFMVGRYGTDQFNRSILVAALALIIFNWFVHRRPLYYLSLALLIWAYVRMFSKNIAARARENQVYLQKTERIRRFFRINQRRISERGTYRYFKCPSCGQEVRVPKGRGRVMITCPKCRTEFAKKT